MQSWWPTQKDIGRIIMRISSKIWNDEKIRESDEKKRVSDNTISGSFVERNGSCFRTNSHHYTVSEYKGENRRYD